MGSIALRGAVITMGGQLLAVAIQVGGLIVLARLLSPDDYGVIAMVLALVGIGEVLRDFGLSAASVQAPSVTAQQRSNLFWINTAIGLGLAAITFLCAPLVAKFYKTPALLQVTQAMALVFVFNGLSTQFRAQLTRDMHFARLSACNVAGQATGLALAVVLALSGFGYWALVAQQLGLAVATLLLLILAGRWRPGLPRRCEGMGHFLSFGWNLMLTQLIGYLSRSVDAIIVGQRFGTTALGFYNRALQLVMLPLYQINTPAGTVALPVLSKLHREPARYNEFLVQGQSALLHLMFSMLAFGAAQAEALVAEILGERWLPLVPLFQILCVGGMFQAASNASYWAFVSKGLTRSHFHFTLVAKPLLIAGIFIGSIWGVRGVAIALALGQWANWAGSLWWLRHSGAPVRRMLANGLLLATAYGACGAAAAFVPHLLNLQGWSRVAAGLATMALAFATLFVLLPQFRESVRDVLRTVRLARASNRPPGPRPSR